jgi:hypothetical protein
MRRYVLFSPLLSRNDGCLDFSLRSENDGFSSDYASVWFAKTSAETKDGAVLGRAVLNRIIASIMLEDCGGHEPECVEDTYIYKGPAESRSD